MRAESGRTSQSRARACINGLVLGAHRRPVNTRKRMIASTESVSSTGHLGPARSPACWVACDLRSFVGRCLTLCSSSSFSGVSSLRFAASTALSCSRRSAIGGLCVSARATARTYEREWHEMSARIRNASGLRTRRMCVHALDDI
jgi:hypothetical protein